MTNQEAIEAIKLARSQVEWDYPMDYAAAFDKAIEALEQEPILDKIRAEILKDCGYSKDYVGTFTYSTIKVANVFQILDKYKAETEDT